MAAKKKTTLEREIERTGWEGEKYKENYGLTSGYKLEGSCDVVISCSLSTARGHYRQLAGWV